MEDGREKQRRRQRPRCPTNGDRPIVNPIVPNVALYISKVPMRLVPALRARDDRAGKDLLRWPDRFALGPNRSTEGDRVVTAKRQFARLLGVKS
jgi:hypothetical protein